VIHLQCTHSVLKHFGVRPKDLRQADESDALLGNWSVTNFVVDRRHAFLFMSDRTLLSFMLLEGKMRFDLSKVQGLLQGGLSQLLAFAQFSPDQIQSAVAGLDVIAVTRTKDRALLGNLTSLADEYQHRICVSGGFAACDLTQITLSVNEGPQRRLGWSSSFDITRELLASPHAASAHGGVASPAK
jgi:hypothetical protein